MNIFHRELNQKIGNRGRCYTEIYTEISIAAVENNLIKINIFIKINLDKIQKKAANNDTTEREETVDHIIGN